MKYKSLYVIIKKMGWIYFWSNNIISLNEIYIYIYIYIMMMMLFCV